MGRTAAVRRAHRPDIIELKLVLEADDQRRIQAENSALPQLDATALYRWNGLTGACRPPASGFRPIIGQFTDWSVGINFSVPLGLREGRARVREQDLIILRDRANLEQGLHAAAATWPSPSGSSKVLTSSTWRSGRRGRRRW